MNRGFPSLVGLLVMTSITIAQHPVRVACIGDSITYGDQLADRATQSYPAVLERLSQGRFVTGNFGVTGATALNDIPFRSWTGTTACREALAFNPDIVVVMLGINDLAFPDQYSRYPADLRAILERFQSLPSSPRVFLCTLTPIAPEEQQAFANQTIRDTMNPAIRAVAADTGAHVIDISSIFPNQSELLPDGLHPCAEGAALIARTVLSALDAKPSNHPPIQSAPASGPVDISIRNEAFAAKSRAERWMEAQPPPTNLPPPASFFEGRDLSSPDDVADLLPLLSGQPSKSGADLFYSYAALAFALDRVGQEIVFLSESQPVAWREALLHELVLRQKIDAGGGGYWPPPDATGDVSGSIRATAYALQAMAIALGE
jgi:acyl-CoA thioesterase I